MTYGAVIVYQHPRDGWKVEWRSRGVSEEHARLWIDYHAGEEVAVYVVRTAMINGRYVVVNRCLK